MDAVDAGAGVLTCRHGSAATEPLDARDPAGLTTPGWHPFAGSTARQAQTNPPPALPSCQQPAPGARPRRDTRAYQNPARPHARISAITRTGRASRTALLLRWAAGASRWSWAGTWNHAGRTSPRRSTSASPTTCCRCWCLAAAQQPGPDHPDPPQYRGGRADHLYYALWVNRAQPVNAYNWPAPKPGEREPLEEVFPNVVPTVPLET